MAKLVDGKRISQEIKDELKAEVADLAQQGKTASWQLFRLAEIRHPAYMYAIRKNACIYRNWDQNLMNLPEETTEEELLALIQELNQKEEVHEFWYSFRFRLILMRRR